MRNICVIFFLAIYFFSASTMQDDFHLYDYKGKVKLQINVNGTPFDLNPCNAHLPLKERVSVARSFFDTLGVSDAWQSQGTHDRSNGNIAAASMEFIFCDATVKTFSILSSKQDMFFNTMVGASQSLADFSHVCGLATYSVQSMNRTIYSKESLFASLSRKDTNEINFDTEAQIVQQIFFTDLYKRMLAQFSKKLKDINYIILHIYTERDPCSNCRKILSTLSRIMNTNKCSPDVFLKSSTITRNEVPNAQFIIIVSSEKGYGDARQLELCLSPQADKSNSCIFMPIDRISSFQSVLSPVKEEDNVDSIQKFVQERVNETATNEQIIAAANRLAKAIHPKHGALVEKLIGKVNEDSSAKGKLLNFWRCFKKAGGNGMGEPLQEVIKIPSNCDDLKIAILDIFSNSSKKQLKFGEIKEIVQGNLTKMRGKWRQLIPSFIEDNYLDKLSNILKIQTLSLEQIKRFEEVINKTEITRQDIDELYQFCTH